MPLLPYITQPLLPEQFYHIYNRGNEYGTLICFNEDNYLYFLKKLKQYMASYMDTYAYCILPDHYHLAVRIKMEQEVLRASVKDLKVIRKDAWERLQLKLADMRSYLAVFSETHDDVGNAGDTSDSLEDPSKLPNLAQASTPPINDIIPVLPPPLLTDLASWAISERFRRFHLGYAKATNKQQGRRGSLMQKPFRRKKVDGPLGMKRLIAYIHRNGVHHGYVAKIEDYPHSSFRAILSESKTSLARKAVRDLYTTPKEFYRYHRIKSDWGDDFIIENI